jgi:hypothetical protein
MTPMKRPARAKRTVVPGGLAVESFGDEFPDLVGDRADLDDEIVLKLKRIDMERLCVFIDYYPCTQRGYVFARRIVGEIQRALRGGKR